MSRCRIDLEWADGVYPFCLPLAQLEELQTLCEAGPLVIARRLEAGEWTHRDIYQTIRLGLIGGGMTPIEAMRKCKLYVLERPWLENIPCAVAILQVTLIGKPDEPVGKSSAVERESDPAAETESSISATSTASAS
jgi:hypothetical protein